LRGAFKLRDVDLYHLQHGLHCSGMLDEIGQPRGHDLPRQSELVLEPAALNLAAAGGELRPVFVNVLLRVAPHDKRNRFGKFVIGATVEGGKFLATKLEGNGEDAALGPVVVIDREQLVKTA
jgi:hypothetical protein